jgi:hypothetical protein
LAKLFEYWSIHCSDKDALDFMLGKYADTLGTMTDLRIKGSTRNLFTNIVQEKTLKYIKSIDTDLPKQGSLVYENGVLYFRITELEKYKVLENGMLE